MDDRPAGVPIESLNLGAHLTKNLKAAGITTISELEAALGNESDLKNRVVRCGDKAVQQIKQALEAFRKCPTVTNTDPSPDKNKSKETSWPKAKIVGALVVLGCLVLPTFVGLALVLAGGHHLSRDNYRILVLLVVAMIVFVFFAFFNRSAALAEGTVLGFNVRIVGPVAAVIGLFGAFMVRSPPPPNRVVQLYLEGGDETSSRNGFGNFTVHYIRPNGAAQQAGTGFSAVIQDIPWDANTVEVMGVDCVGYVPERTIRGEQPPWTYPLTKDGDWGSVRIAMAKQPLQREKEPTAIDVRDLWKARGLTANDIRSPGKFDKDHVHLTIENATDRVIDFVALDCTTVLPMAEPSPVDQGFSTEFAYRNIPPGASKKPSAFSGFWKPTGWFAIYVRYDDPASNRKVRKPVGVYNLFNVREPKLVIRRRIDGKDSVEFEIDESRSRLEE